MSEKLTLNVKSFKKMDDPTDTNGRPKYVCYVETSSIPEAFSYWMGTNPREQKMNTNVAKRISSSLEDNSNFHELNRGILMSVDSITFDNKTNTATIEMTDPTIHGNIDGGHTLRTILDNKNRLDTILNTRYVFCEFITGLQSPVDLAEARNTSVQVDTKSIEELKNNFQPLKQAMAELKFADKIAYRMNEEKPIDIREIIAIIIMFTQEIFPNFTQNGTLADTQPIQCYSGKESSLRKFINLKNREEIIKNMQPVIKDIFDLWDEVEKTFADKANATGKYRYGTRKYSKYTGEIIGQTTFYENDIKYIIPRGLMFPLVGAFRALICRAPNGTYYWLESPLKIWNNIGSNLTGIILEEKAENPDMIAKNSNLWSNLFKEVYINGVLLKK
ncbi:MAG: AIPR family protein [Fusobacterium sp.]|nr:AIPR family protein [Fusobacterium sp.]